MGETIPGPGGADLPPKRGRSRQDFTGAAEKATARAHGARLVPDETPVLVAADPLGMTVSEHEVAAIIVGESIVIVVAQSARAHPQAAVGRVQWALLEASAKTTWLAGVCMAPSDCQVVLQKPLPHSLGRVARYRLQP